MKKQYRKTKAIIDLQAFEHNLRFLKSTLPNSNTFFCPMIKSNAYGHGDIELGLVCEKVGVSGVGVALLEEGVGLRTKGLRCPIFVYGPILDDAVEQLITHELTAVIGQWPELKVLAQTAETVGRQTAVHIKFNTGMNRLGFDIQQAETLQKFFQSHPSLRLEGLCTHLACGDDMQDSKGLSRRQLQQFNSVVPLFKEWTPLVHVWNSSGWFAAKQSIKIDSSVLEFGVRPGISIYGVQPLSKGAKQPLKPVMSLVSELVTIQRVKKGETVSYGATWTAARDSIIGVVPVGYADGYSRAFSNRGAMLVDGKRVPVVGIVCMDYTMLDLTDLRTVSEQDLGKEVVTLGAQGDQIITAEWMAQVIQTIPYEIITCIGSRVPRVFKDL